MKNNNERCLNATLIISSIIAMIGVGFFIDHLSDQGYKVYTFIVHGGILWVIGAIVIGTLLIVGILRLLTWPFRRKNKH